MQNEAYFRPQSLGAPATQIGAAEVNLEQKALTIGWIGTGVMGKSMASHLINKGYKLLVHNRTKAKADELVRMGAVYCDHPRDIAKKADYLVLMLGFPNDVQDMVFGTGDAGSGILEHMRSGSYLIDHTTSSPGLAERIAAEAKKKGIFSIDAPVSGGDIGAKNGKLVAMIGGEAAAVEKCMPLFRCYSAECQNMGGPGAGQHTKAANQIMIGSTMIGLCEALIYSHKAGLPLDSLIELLSKGAAGSFSLAKLAPRMLKRDFDPGFYVEHFVKDLGIALSEAKRMGISMPGTALAD